MPYYWVADGQLRINRQPQLDSVPLTHYPEQLLPPMISALHRGFRAWGDIGLSPGEMRPDRIWFNSGGALTIHMRIDFEPRPLMQVGPAPDVAAWLVMLDQWMETFVVIARARAVWSIDELASALTFLSPAFLPSRLLALSPDNWVRVAQAVALSVADGPLQGTPNNRHWQESV